MYEKLFLDEFITLSFWVFFLLYFSVSLGLFPPDIHAVNYFRACGSLNFLVTWQPGRNECVCIAAIQKDMARSDTIEFSIFWMQQRPSAALFSGSIPLTYRWNSSNSAFTRLPWVVICSAALAGLS